MNARVQFGGDPAILQSIGDPSDAIDRQAVLRFADETLQEFTAALPPGVRRFLAESIDLYLGRTNEPLLTAHTIYDIDRAKMKVRTRGLSAERLEVIVDRCPVPIIRGIVLYLNDTSLDGNRDASVRHSLVHELLHVLVQPAFCSNTLLSEAVVERLTLLLPDALGPPRELRHLSWQTDEFWSSCGLRHADFADIERSEGLRTALVALACTSLRDLPVTVLWAMSEDLLELSAREQRAPTFLDCLKGARHCGGKDVAEMILTSPVGRSLVEGTQAFVLPFDGDSLFVSIIDVQRNPDFMIADRRNGFAWDKTEFYVKDKTLSVPAVISDGRQSVDATITIGGPEPISGASIRASVEKQLHMQFDPNQSVVCTAHLFGHELSLPAPPPSDDALAA
jgi:hypothetical protein